MDKINIKIKISDREYPITINKDEEIYLIEAQNEININIDKLKLKYKIIDNQDLITMTCLEILLKNKQNKIEFNSILLDEIINKLDS